MDPSSDELQRVLGFGRDAWKPREGEAWDAFIRRKAPSAPAIWIPFERADWKRALVLPFWVENNEDEVARDDEWRKVLLVTFEADDELLLEIDLEADEALCARAELAIVRGSFVTHARAYAPDVAAATRFGRFAVVDSILRAIVERVVEAEAVTLTPSPARFVPGFSAEYVPAFEGGALHAAAERIAAKLSFDGSELGCRT